MGLVDGDRVGPGQVVQVVRGKSQLFAVKIGQQPLFLVLRVDGNDLANLPVEDALFRIILQLQDPVAGPEDLIVHLQELAFGLRRIQDFLQDVVEAVDSGIPPVHGPQDLDVVSRKAALQGCRGNLADNGRGLAGRALDKGVALGLLEQKLVVLALVDGVGQRNDG